MNNRIVVRWNGASAGSKSLPNNDIFFIGYRIMQIHQCKEGKYFYEAWIVFVSRFPDLTKLDEHFWQIENGAYPSRHDSTAVDKELLQAIGETYQLRQSLYQPLAVKSQKELKAYLFIWLFSPLFSSVHRRISFQTFADMLGNILLQKSIAIIGQPQEATAVLQVLKMSLQPIMIAGNFISFASGELAKSLFQSVTPVYFCALSPKQQEKTSVKIYDLKKLEKEQKEQKEKKEKKKNKEKKKLEIYFYDQNGIGGLQKRENLQDNNPKIFDWKKHAEEEKERREQELDDYYGQYGILMRQEREKREKMKNPHIKDDLKFAEDSRFDQLNYRFCGRAEGFINQIRKVWQQELLQPMRLGVSTVPDKPFWREFRGTQNYELTVQRVKEGQKI